MQYHHLKMTEHGNNTEVYVVITFILLEKITLKTKKGTVKFA